MRISSIKLAIGAVLLSSSIAAHAANITIGGCNDGTGGYTTCDVGATVETFDSGVLPANFTLYSGDGGNVESTSVSGEYAAPLSDSSPYLAVPTNGTPGAVEAFLGTTYNYFGIYWGSIDTFNELTFLNNGVEVAAVAGSDVLANSALEGNQLSPGSNVYVNIGFGGGTYNEVIISSSAAAFESDNYAFANNVPAPTSLGLMGLGLLGAAFGMRRRQADPTTVTA